MEPSSSAPLTSDTWPDFELPGVYPVDLEGLTEEERTAALSAIEEIIRPLRERKDDNDPPFDQNDYAKKVK